MESDFLDYKTTPQSIPNRDEVPIPERLWDTFHFTKEEQEAIRRSLKQAIKDGAPDSLDSPLFTAYLKLKPKE